MTQDYCCCFFKGASQKPQQFSKRFYLTDDNELNELIYTAMSLFKSCNVFQSQDGRNDCNGISEAKENQIHQQTRDPSIPVYERMDKDKFLMYQCSKFKRMQQEFMSSIPRKELVHQHRNLFRRW